MRRIRKKITRLRLRRFRGRRKIKRVHRSAYNNGFNHGYNQGYDKGREEGYRHGKYDGESGIKGREDLEALVDSLLPEYEILPDMTIEQIVAAGVEHLRPHFLHLLNPQELGSRLLHALDAREPMSVVRLGDGELFTLAQGVVLSIEQVKREGSFLDYAGVNVPDFAARDRLVDAVRQATVVGIPKLRMRNFQPLAFAVFRAHGIDYRSLTLTDSLINYYLYHSGYLSRILGGRRVLLIGNLAEPLARYMEASGVSVAGAIAPVHGVDDVSRVMGEVAGRDFDIALVAAGIAAVLIAQRIASELGKVAIDFGHLANAMVKGEAPYK